MHAGQRTRNDAGILERQSEEINKRKNADVCVDDTAKLCCVMERAAFRDGTFCLAPVQWEECRPSRGCCAEVLRHKNESAPARSTELSRSAKAVRLIRGRTNQESRTAPDRELEKRVSCYVAVNPKVRHLSSAKASLHRVSKSNASSCETCLHRSNRNPEETDISRMLKSSTFRNWKVLRRTGGNRKVARANRSANCLWR